MDAAPSSPAPTPRVTWAPAVLIALMLACAGDSGASSSTGAGASAGTTSELSTGAGVTTGAGLSSSSTAATSGTGEPPSTTTSTSTSSSSVGTSGTSSSATTMAVETTDAPGSSTTGARPRGAIEVLFIGNSYTAGNDLAGLVEALAAADPEAPEINAEVIAMGGQTMAGHLATQATLDVIATGGWDFVALQGQSVEPVFPDNSEFIDAGIELAELVGDAGATPALFETWARAAGHELYDEAWYGPDPAAAQAKLRAAYQQVADASAGVMAPAGDAWEIIWEEEPAIELYAGDGSHAAIAGAYLAACVFFKVFSDRSPVGNQSVPDGVDADTATLLQQAADEVYP